MGWDSSRTARLTTIALPVCVCAAAAPVPGSPPRILEAGSPALQIVDGGDRLAGMLSKDVDPDVYVVHPSTRPKVVSYVTDAGRIDFNISPGERRDFAIRYRGRLYNQRIDTTDPNAPRYRGGAAHPGGRDAIPFRLGANNAIHLTGSINGSEPLDLIFDTGAAIGVHNEGSAAKGAPLRPGRRNRIQIGDVVIDGLPLVHIEYDGTSRNDGVVGLDSFAGRVVRIDYNRQVLTILHDLPDTTGYARVPITWREQNSMVPMTIATPAGIRRTMALFDTGSRWSLTMGNRDAAASDVRALGPIGTHTGRKADGTEVVADVTTLPWAAIAGFRLPNVQADVERPAADTALPLNILGNDFLKRFNVIVDYRASEIYLKPNQLVTAPYNRVFPVEYLAIGTVIASVAAIAVLITRRRRGVRRSLKQPRR